MLPLIAAMLLLTPAGGLSACVWRDPSGSIWKMHLPGGGVAITLVNQSDRPISLNVTFSRLGVAGRARVWNVTRREDWGSVQGGFAQRVEPRSRFYFRLLPDPR
jgi:hypothetical protein